VRRLAFILLLGFALTQDARAAEIDVTTYYDAPFGDYKEFRLSGTLAAGLVDADPGPLLIGAGSYTAAFFGGFNVWNNDIPGHLGASRGGGLTVTGNLDIQDALGISLLYVNATTDRVGIGTRAPAAALDVRGEAKAINLFAYASPLDPTQPYAEMNTEVTPERFGAGYWWNQTFPHRYRFCTMHIDGDPIAIQSIDKSAMGLGGLGRGQLIINGMPVGYVTYDAKVILVVGEPQQNQVLDPDPDEATGDGDGDPNQGDYPVALPKPQAFAHQWYQFSSREYKKDIVPLMPAEYGTILSSLAVMDVVRYRFHSESGTTKPHVGLIAEDVPEDMAQSDRKSIGLGEQAAFLLASAKALRGEQDDMRARVERLKKS